MFAIYFLFPGTAVQRGLHKQLLSIRYEVDSFRGHFIFVFLAELMQQNLWQAPSSIIASVDPSCDMGTIVCIQRKLFLNLFIDARDAMAKGGELW